MSLSRKLHSALIALILFLHSPVSFAAPVNINTASAEEIAASLSGVGIAKARAIVAHRNSNGLFKSRDALAEVKGIGKRTVAINAEDILIAEESTD